MSAPTESSQISRDHSVVPGLQDPVPSETTATTGRNRGENQGDTTAPRELVTVEQLSAVAFVTGFRLDNRFIATDRRIDGPITTVKINFANFIEVIAKMAKVAFTNWQKLRDLVSADENQITTHIEAGCDQLAISSAYSLYNHLGIVTQTSAPTHANIYRNRAPQSRYKQLPAGICSLIQQFGITEPVEFYGNARFLHLWDNADNTTFGIPAGQVLNDNILSGFLNLLHKAGVNFSTVPARPPLRTVWDSLNVEAVDTGFSVHTTFPRNEYNLPIDTFLALAFRAVPTNYTDVIQEYAPRIDELPADPTVALINDSTAGVVALGTRTRGPDPLANQITVNRANFGPCNHLQNVTPPGVHYEDPGANAPVPRIHVFGRGDQTSAMCIKTVARGVTTHEIEHFAQCILRNGM